jgi:PAS domain S-box-containing protein
MAPLFVPKDRKSLFRQFLAGMYDAVVITDPNGHILEINPRAEEYFGCSQEDVIDRTIAFFIPGLSPEIVQRIRKGLENDRHMLIDANGESGDGTKFACEVAVSIIDLMDPGDLVFTVRNVERRRRIMEMLRAKETAFQISQAALFSCDVEGRFTHANDAFLRMFGLEDEDAARSHVFSDFMSDDPLPANFLKAVDGEETSVGIVAETDGDVDDDEEIEISLAPIRSGRKIKGVAGSIFKV